MGCKKNSWIGLFALLCVSLLQGQAAFFEPNVGQFIIPDSYQGVRPLAVFHHSLGQVYVCEDRLRIRLINTQDKPLIHQSFHFQHTDTAFTIREQVFDIIFENALEPKEVQYKNKAPYYINYYLGENSKDWRTNIHPVKSITLKNLYTNTDLRIYIQNNQVEFDWILKPGSNAENINLRFEGQKKMRLSQNHIRLIGENAQFSMAPPFAYKGQRRKKLPPKQIKCHYVKTHANRIKLELGAYNPQDTIVIDPILVFSTYSGSTADNFGFTATYDNQGCLYAGGIVDASSRNYPVTPGAFQTVYGGSSNAAEPVYLPCDISISKYSPDGKTLLYATYLGGSNNEYPHSLATDLQDNLLLLGSTVSTNYPVHQDSAFQLTPGGGYDIVLTKFNSSSEISTS